MKTNTYTLPNGLRILHLPVSSEVAHAALYIHVGTRDELPGEEGMAHFIEHAVFKGTQKRKAWHILNRLEKLGGDLNAYTAKEETCLYASFLLPHMDKALELFSDIAFHSVFPEKEILKEKQVVIDEIDAYKDNPQEEILDVFEEKFFEGHPLANRILGTKKSVKGFSSARLHNFIQKHYVPSNMLICTTGRIELQKVVALVSKYFDKEVCTQSKTKRLPFSSYTAFHDTRKFSNYQSHSVIGAPAYPMNHPKRYGLSLLNNLLGGPAMSSRLNMNIREKHGYTYIIESNYQTYTDSGFLYIYFGTESAKIEKVRDLTLNELKNLCQKKLGVIQLNNARQQYLGQFALAAESNSGKMLAVGKHFLHGQEIFSQEEIARQLFSFSATDLLDIANEVFAPETISTLSFVPKK